METPTILVWPVVKTRNPFSFKEGHNPFIRPFFPTDWSSDDPYDLSVSLSNQARNNLMIYEAIGVSCDEYLSGESTDVFTVETDEDEGVYTKTFDMSDRDKLAACTSFNSRSRDLMEVLSRDQDALSLTEGMDLDIHACVLLVGGAYQGHVYVWLSASGEYCFIMGIRNRIDSVYTKYTGEQFKNVSYYLLEGARRFAVEKGASKLFVVYPKPIMKRLLPNMGFRPSKVLASDIGKSISPPSYGMWCTQCFEYDDIGLPITNLYTAFHLIKI